MPARKWRSPAAAAVSAFAGAGDPEQAVDRLVDGLLDECGVAGPPVDVEMLASLRRVRRVELVEMAEAGRLVPEGSGYVIHVNERHAESKRRFTIAHEVGHTFFDEATAALRYKADGATGLFEPRSEEEYLCDMAAARALLHPHWLEPLARADGPSLEALFALAQTCGASIEATAIQLSRLGRWRCSFVFWEPGLRKAERLRAAQPALGGWEGPAGPQEKLRAQRVYGPAGVPFLPRNKSIDSGSQVWRAYAEETTTEGEELLDLGATAVPAAVQSTYAPYFGEGGVLRPRVISCVIWLNR
jgi:hypothetical protein